MNNGKASPLKLLGATLAALVLLPVTWSAIGVLFLRIGGWVGGPENTAAVENFVKAGWFVGPPVAGFVALWATGALIHAVPPWRVFKTFSLLVCALFALGLIGGYASGMMDNTLLMGMIAQLALTIGGAWLGARVAGRG